MYLAIYGDMSFYIDDGVQNSVSGSFVSYAPGEAFRTKVGKTQVLEIFTIQILEYRYSHAI